MSVTLLARPGEQNRQEGIQGRGWYLLSPTGRAPPSRSTFPEVGTLVGSIMNLSFASA